MTNLRNVILAYEVILIIVINCDNFMFEDSFYT